MLVSGSQIILEYAQFDDSIYEDRRRPALKVQGRSNKNNQFTVSSTLPRLPYAWSLKLTIVHSRSYHQRVSGDL